MLKLSKDHKYILLVVAVIVIGCVYAMSSRAEGFSSCYQKRMVYLQDAEGGRDGGFAQFERRQGKLTVTMKANLPLSEAGVFTTLPGQYWVRLEGKGKEPLVLGKMIRGAYRTYYLTDQLLGDYDGYSRICVYHKIKGYKDRLMLKGKL